MPKFIVETNNIFYKGAHYEIGEEVDIAKEDMPSYEGVVKPKKEEKAKDEKAKDVKPKKEEK